MATFNSNVWNTVFGLTRRAGGSAASRTSLAVSLGPAGSGSGHRRRAETSSAAVAVGHSA